MKTILRGVIAFALVMSTATVMYGQDLSKYRNFSFGMSTSTILKLVQEKSTEVVDLYQQPALIQELRWSPPQTSVSGRPVEPVEDILFFFYNDQLYRMLMTYDMTATVGLTDEDMIGVLSAKYGIATKPKTEISLPADESYRLQAQVTARWEDPQYSLNLVRSSSGDTFAIVLLAKQMDSQATLATAQSVKLEEQQAPAKEAARVKQAAADLEAERQKNIKALRP